MPTLCASVRKDGKDVATLAQSRTTIGAAARKAATAKLIRGFLILLYFVLFRE